MNKEDDVKAGHNNEQAETTACEEGEASTDLPETIAEQESSETLLSKEILVAVTGIASELNSVKGILKKRLSYDETKEKAFDRLYEELDSFKKNTAFNAIRPLFVDMILLFDRIENVRQEMKQAQGSNTIDFPELLKTLSEEITEILYRHGTDVINSASATFDPMLQQAIAAQPTTDEAENNTIAQVVRRGFKYQDRIIRPEEVIVRRYAAK